jgi:2-methylisocitrate lyase-like PEP mutase family enzyme
MNAGPSLKDMLAAGPVLAPAVFSPLSARVAQAAGFRALYLGGGALGYLKCVLEANLGLQDVVAAGLDIMVACDLPLIMDAAAGYGDPMHVGRTVRMAEQAGFAAIEIEDQVLPKRAHHHVGVDHVVALELMVSKIEEAVRARRNPDFLIIGRTNALRCEGLDAALRRGEAILRAGADLVFLLPSTLEETVTIGKTFGPKLMFPAGLGFDRQALGMSVDELCGLGYRLIADGGAALCAAHAAMREAYAWLARPESDPAKHAALADEMRKVQATVGLPQLLDIEKRTLKL